MTQPLSNDLGKRMVEAVEGGLSCNAAAGHYKVAVSTVVRLMQRWRQTGSWQALPQGGYFGHKLSPYREQVEQILAGQRDLTLAEMVARLEAEGISVSKSAVDRFLYHVGQLFKKALCAAEQDRVDVAAARAAWKEAQPGLDPEKLVFIDETGASTNMTRQRGRCPVGERLVCKTLWGHWKTTTFVGGLRANGMTAPLVLDGPMNGDIFLAGACPGAGRG